MNIKCGGTLQLVRNSPFYHVIPKEVVADVQSCAVRFYDQSQLGAKWCSSKIISWNLHDLNRKECFSWLYVTPQCRVGWGRTCARLHQTGYGVCYCTLVDPPTSRGRASGVHDPTPIGPTWHQLSQSQWACETLILCAPARSLLHVSVILYENHVTFAVIYMIHTIEI